MARVVSGKQCFRVNLQAEQITDRVGVLHPVEAVGGHATRFRVDRAPLVERSFEPSAESIIANAIRPWSSGWWHEIAA